MISSCQMMNIRTARISYRKKSLSSCWFLGYAISRGPGFSQHKCLFSWAFTSHGGNAFPAPKRLQKDTISTSSNINELARILREVHERSSTDGVMKDFVPELLAQHSKLDSDWIIELALEAGKFQSGVASSILHGVMAGTTSQQQYQLAPQLFQSLCRDNQQRVSIDLVTCALAFNSCQLALKSIDKVSKNNSYFSAVSESCLEAAFKLAKKGGGSAQRKAMSQAKRAKTKAQVNARATESKNILKEKYDLEILYEDDQVVCLNKPAGMVCYHNRQTTKGKRGEDTSLENALLSVVTLSLVNQDARGIVHRIDRGTSGCIVMAKTDEAHLMLVAEFFSRRAKKSYLALVDGAVQEKKGVLDLPIGGQPSRSMYEVKQIYKGSSHPTTSTLVEVFTETGRKHQVRIHCAQGLGCPIYLDNLYYPKPAIKDSKKRTGDHNTDKLLIPRSIDTVKAAHEPGHRFFLHASKLQIPAFGIDIEAPLPSWWREAIDHL